MRGFLYLSDTLKEQYMESNVQEIWKDIKGFEGLYLVSNLGRIKSVSRNVWGGKKFYRIQEKIKKQSTCHYGYLVVMLYKDNFPKMLKVHRIIATAFIENPNNYPFINHKDGNKQNNSIENLEWCNHQMNMRHSFDTGLNKGGWFGKYGFNHCQTKKIQCTATGKIYTMKEAADFIGVSRSGLCLMLKNINPNWSTFIYG